MNDREKREETLFNAALQLATPEERAAYLKEACKDDEPLRQRVVGLLQGHDQADALLDKPAAGLPARTLVLDPAMIQPTEKAGDKIGRYKLLQQIGEGGCGVVYMADQEEPVRRRVALKIIKLGMDTKQVIARFEAERQALALMDHPNIAKVLDAGATETGRPYFVMELVRGIRITDYCDQNNLSTRERLNLFNQVCNAIQHAHQKGIIHRDIKPSNILVTMHDGVPVPKVIDFGIAKATEQRLTDKTLFTAFEQFMGTPAYMSPEQAEMSGLGIDARSDIYALGVLLYELLTGKTPFDAKELLQAGLDEMRRTIREKEPVRPSTCLNTMQDADLTTVAKHRQADPSKLAHLLRGDLDWIVMKTLEKDRTRRYETANSLAADIQRHLQNEPVVARPPSNFYRFQKLVRRNKLAFAAASAVAVALILGFGVSIWLHRNDPEFAAQQAVIQAQNTLGNDNPGLPGIMLRLVDVLKENHKTAEAREWAEEAAALYRSHPDWNAEKRKEVLDTLNQELKDLGEFNEAVSVQEERLQVLRAHRAADDPEFRNALAELTWTYLLTGKYVEAEPIARECLALCQRTLPDDGGTFWVQSMLGESLTRQKRYAEAEPLLLAAYDGFKKHEDEIGTDWRAHEIIANMAPFYEATHQPERAAEWGKKERDFEKAQNAAKSASGQPESSLTGIEAARRQELADARKRLGKDNPELPNYIINLIKVLVTDGKGDEASLLGDEVIGLIHSHPDWPVRAREDSLDMLNGILEPKGMYGASASVQAERLSILRATLPADDPELRDALENYAWTLYAINEPVKSEAVAREYLAVCERKYPGYYRIGFVQSVLGGCLTKQKRYKEAEPLLLAGYEGVMAHKDEADVGDGTQFVCEPTARLVWFFEQTGRPDEAAKWKQKLDELEKANGMTNSISQSP